MRYTRFLLFLFCTLLVLGVTWLGPTPLPIEAAVTMPPTLITGEVKYIPYYGPHEVHYIQTITVLSNVTTSLDVSTGCPDVDAFLCQYALRSTAVTAESEWYITLGTVETATPPGMTAGMVTIERATDPAVSTDDEVTICLIDRDW